MMDADDVIELGKIKIIPSLNQVILDGEPLSLEPKVILVLNVLVRHANQPVTREFIIEQVWSDYIVGEDSLNRAISQIRKSIREVEGLKIETIRGIGYQLVNDQEISSVPAQSKSIRLPSPQLLVILGVCLLALAVIGWQLSIKDPIVKKPQGILKQTAITSELGIEWSHTVSPDNKYIAYIWNGGDSEQWHIYIRDIRTGKVIKFGEEELNNKVPSWSNDGTQLAFFTVIKGGFVLKTSPFLSYEPTIIDTVKSIPKHSVIDWSPDDSHLIYSALEKGDLYYKIYRYDFLKQERKVIKEGSAESKDYSNVIYSPKGKHIAMVQRDKQNVVMFRELNRVVPANVEVYDTETEELIFEREYEKPIYCLSWKNPSTMLFSTKQDNKHLIKELNIFTGEEEIILTTDRMMEEISYNMKEETIYAESWYGDVNMHKAMYSKGQLTDDKIFLSSSRFDWGATLDYSGTQLAFLSDRSGSTEIWCHNLITGETRQVSKLMNVPNIDALAWDHSGTRIAINPVIERKRGYVIVIDMNGRELMKLVDVDNSYSNPHWSSDDKFIYLSRSDTARNLTNVKLDFETKQFTTLEIPPSLDVREIGNDLYFIQQDKRGIWKAPKDNQGQVSMITDRLSYYRFKYWDIKKDKLFMINLYGYNNVLEVIDLKTKQLIDSIGMPQTIPSIEPSAAFLDNGEIVYPIVDGMESEIISLTYPKDQN